MAGSPAISPSKPDPATFATKLKFLSADWDLGLEPIQEYSPSKATAKESIIGKLSACFYNHVYNAAVEEFKADATKLYNGWIKQSGFARGFVPEKTRDNHRPVSGKEREQLLQLLKDTLDRHLQAYPRTPRKLRQNSSVASRALPTPTFGNNMITEASKFKRSNDDSFVDFSPSKRMRAPESQALTKTPVKVSASTTPRRPQVLKQTSVYSYLSKGKTTLSEDFPNLASGPRRPTVSDQTEVNNSLSSGGSSRELISDSSQQYWPSSLEDHFDLLEKLQLQSFNSATSLSSSTDNLTAENKLLQDRLRVVFPELPSCLHSAPFCVAYEVVRVFQYVGVPLSRFSGSIPQDLEDYPGFWTFLTTLPALQGCKFPESTNPEIWAAALSTYERGSQSVVFSGSFKFNLKESEAFFKLTLHPMKFDQSHRLGRRFAHDRFLEISIPLLTGTKDVPESLWLIGDNHLLAGRKWGAFFVKEKEKKKRRDENNIKDLEELEPSFNLYFFATDGAGFNDESSTPCPSVGHPIMTLHQLLDQVRPTRENENQSYLKLFARLSLVLSRNTATVIVPLEQVRYHNSDILSDDGNEPMNDGAARISPSLAWKVIQKLDLKPNMSPVAFQARFGGAKGMWIVDYADRSEADWLEIYPSQQKWTRSEGNRLEIDDPSHRTFEVVDCSQPLQSARLNTQFLPIIDDQARNKKQMKKSISELLEQSLIAELDDIFKSMQNPQLLRQWIRSSHSNSRDRLKPGSISYLGGMPITIEERLNVMLDAGFNPMEVTLMKDMMKTLLKSHAHNLRGKLNIRVRNSCYAYMIPDFWGVLARDEVYLDFTTFEGTDGRTPKIVLDGVDVLVARTPAHFASDIQKVKAVRKLELIDLKDVVVFSTKGDRSLASMLSGGDYDGDEAWVCWQKDIVENFDNARVPAPIDLVAEGFMQKDSTTYAQLVHGHADPVQTFLGQAFAFNMQRGLLGACTNHKEKVAYTLRSVSSEPLLYLNQLLSNLVDAPKQGFLFTMEDWKRFKNEKVRVNTKEQLWKTQGPTQDPNHHIIDHLMFVADRAVNLALKKFHETFQNTVQWDEKLAAYSIWARSLTEKHQDWADLMDHLDKDVEKVREHWKVSFSRPKDQQPKFASVVVETYEMFQAIQPHNPKSSLAQALLPACPERNAEHSNWSLLKASTLYVTVGFRNRMHVPNLVHWLAGKQLRYLKADANKGGALYPVSSTMWHFLKPDGTLIKRSGAGNASAENSNDVDPADDMDVDMEGLTTSF